MRRSIPDPQGQNDEGFATALAMSVSLAISLTAAALLVRAEVDLRIARQALDRSRAEYKLDALQAVAATDLAKDADARPATVSFSGTEGAVHVEEEAAKLLPASAAALPESWLAGLGVKNPKSLKDQLIQWPAAKALTLADLASLDPSPLWRACAASFISERGRSSNQSTAVVSGAQIAGAKLLRLTVSLSGSYVDDRIVRLTADAAEPAVVLDRHFYRQSAAPPPCPAPPDLEGNV